MNKHKNSDFLRFRGRLLFWVIKIFRSFFHLFILSFIRDIIIRMNELKPSLTLYLTFSFRHVRLGNKRPADRRQSMRRQLRALGVLYFANPSKQNREHLLLEARRRRRDAASEESANSEAHQATAGSLHRDFSTRCDLLCNTYIRNQLF